MKKLFNRINVHVAFELSLALKGAFSAGELIASLFTFLTTKKFVLETVQAITLAELTEDPHDFVANYLLHAAQQLSVSSRHFAALYLFSHGIIKLWLVIGLWRGKRYYYPAAIVIFGLFICYQVYRYSFTHSLLLLFITALDGIVIGLTWVEYQRLRRIEFTRRM